MRYLLLIILTCKIYASHISWYGDYDRAHQEALKQKKYLLVLLIKKECPKCSEILTTVFKDQEYIDTINSKFISVIVTKNQKSSYPIELLYTLHYPSIFFLDKNELFLTKPIYGYVTAEILKNYIDNLK
jgi:thioredoxin-related protein